MTKKIKISKNDKNIYRGQEVEGIVETRMRQYNVIKTKRTQVILLDPINLTQHIK